MSKPPNDKARAERERERDLKPMPHGVTSTWVARPLLSTERGERRDPLSDFFKRKTFFHRVCPPLGRDPGNTRRELPHSTPLTHNLTKSLLAANQERIRAVAQAPTQRTPDSGIASGW